LHANKLDMNQDILLIHFGRIYRAIPGLRF
jgi:hypothetical protein